VTEQRFTTYHGRAPSGAGGRRDLRNAAHWSVALPLGRRRGEALGLPWSAVEFDAGTLAVRQALQRQVGNGLVIVRPKSRAGRRVISLPGPLVAALRTHRAAQAQERLVAGSMWQNHLEMVFTQANGHPVDPGKDYQQRRRRGGPNELTAAAALAWTPSAY